MWIPKDKIEITHINVEYDNKYFPNAYFAIYIALDIEYDSAWVKIRPEISTATCLLS